MKKSKTKNILIIFIIILLAVLAFDIFWFIYIEKSAQNVLELKKIANQEMSQNNNLISIKKDISSLEDSKEKINEILIPRDGVVSLIETLENISNVTGTNLKISDVDVTLVTEGTGETKKELYGELKMVLNITGQWAGVTRYLNFVENLPHRVSIDSVRLLSVSNEEMVGWSMNLAITGITH